MTLFHQKAGPFTAEEIAKKLNIDVKGATDKPLFGLAGLDAATEKEISFLDNKKYAKQLPHTQAGAVIVHPSMVDQCPEESIVFVSNTPYATYAEVLQLFYPEKKGQAGVHPTAIIEAGAVVPKSCSIGAGVYVGAGAVLGEEVTVYPQAHIGAGVHIGEKTVVHPNATLTHCLVGKFCLIHPNASIGQDGFGFAYAPEKGILKVPQIGKVKIGDYVEIGANTSIDRGSLKDTEIGDHTKIDNLVQIGHNVKLGKGCQLVSQCGIAGSTTLGDGCIVGGQAGSAGHIQITSGVVLAARTGVTKNITESGTYAGFPAIPMDKWRKLQVAIARLAKPKKSEKKL